MRWLILASILASCTITNVYRDGELESRSWSLGGPPQPDIGAGAVRVTSHTVGVLASSQRFVLGYSAYDALYISRDCIAVFFMDHPENAARIMEILGPTDQICGEIE